MGPRKLVTLVAIVVVGLATAKYLFWNERRDVLRRLDAMIEAASAPPGESAAQREARGARLGAFVTDDVMIRTDASAFVGGRPAVVKFALEAAAARQIHVSREDAQVELIDPSTATAFLTLRMTGAEPQAADPVPRQVHATLSKVSGEWLLSRGEVLRTLEPAK
jgi:hypothetical protein